MPSIYSGKAADMADLNTENYMLNFTLTCDNEQVNFHAEIPSNECIFLWIGQDSTATMAYGLLKHRSVIYGNPTPHSAFQINEFANRLAKIFGHRQVGGFDTVFEIKYSLIPLGFCFDRSRSRHGSQILEQRLYGFKGIHFCAS